MKRICLVLSIAIAAFALAMVAQQAPGPYKVEKAAKVGGAGGFDYVYADTNGRRLYIPRTGQGARIAVFDLDSLMPVGEIANTNARGVAVSSKSGHGFGSSKPVAMWDSKTLMPIKTIEVQGGPDGIMYDPFNDRVWVFSHIAPNATVINAADGSVVGTVDLGGMPEQAASDGNGHLYVDLEDKGQIAAVDAKTLNVTAHYDLQGKGNGCAGLAMDVKNRILFATCRNPQNMVVLKADDGAIVTTLPIGQGTDGAVFNPSTMEAFSSQGDGTLTIVKENSPTNFDVEQTLQTMTGGKTLTLDSKTNRILIIAAEYMPPAAGAPKGRGRGQMVPDSFSILAVGK
ncbi:MAG TPA: hypothetical protein VH639_18175 [Bryobacteraceae bacterium]|jgi:hypothetical protein